MDVREAIETRIDVRDYTDTPVDDGVKRDILHAGRLASSGRNLEHWRFILVDDPAQINRLATHSPTGSWIRNAAFAVVVCTDPSYEFNQLDAGRTVTYMQLWGWAEGLASCIYTVDQEALFEELAIPPQLDLTVVAGFGYPPFAIENVQGAKNRKPLAELAFRNRFGQPLSL